MNHLNLYSFSDREGHARTYCPWCSAWHEHPQDEQPCKAQPTFKAWLTNAYKLKTGRWKDNRFGDLAYDMSTDSNCPEYGTYASILDYLHSRNASKPCVSTFKEAWKKYSAYLQKGEFETQEGLDNFGRPILRAIRDMDGHLRVWCKYCKRWHHHGKHEGHLHAHCFKQDSAYKATGYVLRVVG